MSALHVSRRTAFSLAGAASATVALAACSGGVNGVSSQSERTDFSGEIKFDNFDTSAGEYKPATKDHPAENVPKPKKPDNANDKSAAGFYSSIGYLFASAQYFFESFDPEPLIEVLGDSQVNYDQFKQLKSSNLWIVNPKVVISLKTPQPKVDGDTYTWDAKGTLKYDGIGSNVDAAQQAGEDQTSDITIKGTYKDGQWRMTDPEATSTSGSSSSSGSLFGF